MSGHLGRTPTYGKIAERFFWYRIYNDVANYIQKCDRCQRQSSLSPNVKNEMHSVPVSPHVMKLFDLDLYSLHLIICIDCFIKWSEAKLSRDKAALTVATFLY